MMATVDGSRVVLFVVCARIAAESARGSSARVSASAGVRAPWPGAVVQTSRLAGLPGADLAAPVSYACGAADVGRDRGPVTAVKSGHSYGHGSGNGSRANIGFSIVLPSGG
jgi:hypothetical protein